MLLDNVVINGNNVRIYALKNYNKFGCFHNKHSYPLSVISVFATGKGFIKLSNFLPIEFQSEKSQTHD